MMDKETEVLIEDMHEGILQQGIIIKALIDIIIEKELVSQDEFDKKILKVSKQVQSEIDKLQKDLGEFGDVSYSMGQGGDA